MQGPYGFEMNESCRNCTIRNLGFFCELAEPALNNLERIGSSSAYPEGAILFIEKQNPRGVYLLCQGEVKLSVSSREGKIVIVRIASAGEILGLQAVLSGTPYEVTAETLHACRLVFVYRDEFLRFIANYPETNQNTIKQLTAQYQSTCEQLRTVGLGSSPHEKLAKLLLDWPVHDQPAKDGSRIKMSLTHEELAECIGVTRETVSRTLSEFRNRHLVSIQGSTFVIPNRAALQKCVNL
jgi:CRP/FNR family transcriptional regulator